MTLMTNIAIAKVQKTDCHQVAFPQQAMAASQCLPEEL